MGTAARLEGRLANFHARPSGDFQSPFSQNPRISTVSAVTLTELRQQNLPVQSLLVNIPIPCSNEESSVLLKIELTFCKLDYQYSDLF